MRSAFIALVALAAMAVPAQASPVENTSGVSVAKESAPDQQALQLAREFVAIATPPEAMEKNFVDQLKAMTLMFPGLEMPKGSDAEQKVDKILSAARPAVLRHLPMVTEAFAQAYARGYTRDELHQLVAFAKSPIGEKIFSQGTDILLDPAVTAANKAFMEDAFGEISNAVRIAACQEATAKRVAAGETNAKCPLANG